jgi:uncharacterized protein YbbC (DUF1343 family)
MKSGLPLSRLFTPEHGLSASAPDGVGVRDTVDQETGLPVTSLYGSDFRPPAAALEDLDLILVDLQDVGVRFYTYLWTLSLFMESCSAAGIPVWVLDRPNPLGGMKAWVEGPLPEESAPRTLLCRWPVPIRHSLTLGEMALLLKHEMELDLDLKVVAMEGWRRRMFWADTGLEFVPPSPGIPAPESALLYPALAFLEATNVLEGRGTSHAFRWLGAPWVDAAAMAQALNESGPPGVRAHPLTLDVPLERGECPGISLEVTNPVELRPVALGLRLLSLLRTLFPNRFSWTPYPTQANPAGEDHLLRLVGRSEVVDTLERTPESIDKETLLGWTRVREWWDRAGPFLLYG